jgi:autotransporter-associated beta strand protein
MNILKNIALLTPLLLTACGGGGSDSGSPQEIKKPLITPPIKSGKQPPETNSNKVKIGVLDSGVNKNISNITGKISAILHYVGQGRNLGSGAFTPEDITTSLPQVDMDTSGHGSYVSQILASTGSGGTYVGSQNVQLYEAKTTDDPLGHSMIDDQLAAIMDLHEHYGVNLFNASWGSYNYYDANSPITAVLNYLAKSNGLIVFSAGNDLLNNPTTENLTPLIDHSIENGLITVVGIDGNKQLYSGYDESGVIKGSNACGKAAAWCLAGDYVVGPLLNENNNGYVYFYGTSGAAPQVTAAAANVWQKYPWMTSKQVKQTILTTANYLPDGSPLGIPYNATYGWGELNALRAENGPMLFSSLFGNFSAQVPDSHYIFSNDISGDAGLVKNGNGTLELAGDDSYTGDTTINQGTLWVSGSINRGTVNISPGGSLTGSGSVSSTYNNGTIDLSNGSLKVKGDYSQSHNGILNAYIDNQLDISSNAALDGTVNVVNQNYVVNGTYDILHAQNIQGQFSQVNGSKFLKINHVNYTPDHVNIDVEQVSAQNAASNGDSLSMAGAKAVDSIFAAANDIALKQHNGEVLTADEQQLLDYSAGLQSTRSGEGVQRIVDSHSGVIYSELPSVLLAEQNRLTQTVVNRLSAMHGMGKVTPGVWASYDYMKNQYQPDGWNQVSTTTNNTSVGLDGRVNNALLLGGFVNKNNIAAKLDRNGGSLDGSQNGIGAYGQLNDGDFYLNGLASYQRGDSDIKRPVIGNGTQSSQKSNTDMSSASLYFESGYAFHLPHEADITPYLGVEYDRSNTDSIDEGNLQGVSVSGMKGRQSSVALGSRFNYIVSNELHLSAWAQASKIVARDISDMRLMTNMSGQEISLNSPEFDQNSFDYGLDIDYVLLNRVLFFAGMQRRTANNPALSASAGLKYYW